MPTIDGYDLTHRLWHTDDGEVWRAVSKNSGARVVLKIGHTPAGNARIEREADALAQMVGGGKNDGSDTIVRLFDSALGHATPYIALADFPGSTLAANVAKRGTLDEAELANLLGDMLDGLAFAHSRGVIHGHLSPSAVMVDSGMNAGLVDFGFHPAAKSTDTPAVELAYAGDVGQHVASALFVAPEMADAPGQSPTVAADLFGIGMIAAFALLGDKLRRHIDDSLERAGVSTTMLRIISKLADPNPRQRYESAEAAAKVVRAIYLSRSMTRGLNRLTTRAVGGGGGDDDGDDDAGAGAMNEINKSRMHKLLLVLLLPGLILGVIFVTAVSQPPVPFDDGDEPESNANPDAPILPPGLGHRQPPRVPQSQPQTLLD